MRCLQVLLVDSQYNPSLVKQRVFESPLVPEHEVELPCSVQVQPQASPATPRFSGTHLP